MKKLLSILILTFAIIFALSSCGDDAPTIESEDGYGVINGEKTDVKAEGDKGDTGADGKDAVAEEENPQGLAFYLKDDGTYVVEVGYAKYRSSVEIPATYKGKAVTEIGEFGFKDCASLISVTIPDSVETIGEGAFYGCDSLLHVYISDIENWCNISFKDYLSNPLCEAGNLYLNGELITALVVPDNITVLGSYTFYGCRSLTSVTIPDSVKGIGEDVFYNCNIKEAIIPALAISYIDMNNLRTAVITSGNIGPSAFYECYSLASLEIGEHVEKIEESSFAYCYNLTSITVSKDNPSYKDIDGNLYTKDGKILIKYISRNTDTNFTIPDSVISIGAYAFADCDSLTSVTIPDSVTSIGKYAFEHCRSLINLVFGDGVTTIGDRAFEDCISLTSVYINDIKNWCNISFEDYLSNPFCYAENFYLRGEPATELIIPNGVITMGDFVFYGCNSLTSVTIADGVTTIGDSAFRYCTSLTSVAIPDSVTSIGSHAFERCTSLSSIKFRGTEEEWNAISKASDWNDYAEDSTITYNYDGE